MGGIRIGALVNGAAILLGGLCGALFGRFLNDRSQETLGKVCGVSTLFIGIAGAMQGMLSIQDGALSSGQGMLVTLSLVLGALIGELMNIEGLFERFGEWLKRRTGNASDLKFVDGFVTASLTVSIGAMAVVGSIQDGLLGDPSVLMTKAVLDFIIIMVMTCSMGKGCVFSAIPVLALEGAMTLLAGLLEPVMTPAALASLSMVGSILIFCVGLNLVWGKQLRVGNMLPALVLAVIGAYLI
ncbi:MAG: DUF554 domain-containing protein [Clostridia bacterium]|nr:DUF554 domain-containing protein [Clostridia bacterium]MBQ8973924.1 DUF554 domain-containing protein [Clostridia bacterium]